ncbi:hydrocephalus-inducing protein homolog [Corvus hawaiiensis]|uniref:hydrocephalus-inducing protein homolog n=1 Tax=Corvus hawaiiensis TaxID=134902 RepID=UPI0020199274|nr:hydrocephalus-inducing protein homolog [Corvus hawaiiensis]
MGEEGGGKVSCLIFFTFQLTPSAFQKEMSLTIKQRLASTQEMNLPQVVQLQDKSETSITRHASAMFSAVYPDHRSLQPFPPEVVFQNYTPGEVCEMPVVLRNRDQDYFHQLLCITEREEFIVPICAIGARAILDFPDLLDFSECPVKYSSEKTLLVHNLGNRTARYHLSTQRQYHRLCRQEKDKLSDFLKERRVDTTHREHSALLTRTIQRERARLQGDPMLFNNDIFSLEPKEGEIRPNCSAEINVFFKPQAARVYEQAVYCDISGRETRLPLLLIGEGIGPQLHFSFEELDIGEVFVRAAHSYEMGKLRHIGISGGFVVEPTFHFDVPALHFGDVSFGFPRTLRCSLSNTSLAPMAFNLCIPEDSLGEASICSSLQIFKITHPSWRKGAKGGCKKLENFSASFSSIYTCRGTIRSLGSQDIEAGKRSRWRIEPSKGVVPPKSEVSLIVTANLDDTEKFQDKVKVFIENSHMDIIPVQAVGTGTTIVTDKLFTPELKLGPHFRQEISQLLLLLRAQQGAVLL